MKRLSDHTNQRHLTYSTFDNKEIFVTDMLRRYFTKIWCQVWSCIGNSFTRSMV